MSEIVMKWSPDGEGGYLAFDATDPGSWATLREEVKMWFEGYEGAPGETVGSITVEFAPDGYLDSLGEHPGW